MINYKSKKQFIFEIINLFLEKIEKTLKMFKKKIELKIY